MEKANGVKKQKIQWDEKTIAEHDLERGSRQKIDEAPTPYRYQSESEQSEGETSDAESLVKKTMDELTEDCTTSTLPPRCNNKKKNVLFNNNPNKISDSWETISAKLQYEKHLQDTGSQGSGTASPNNIGKLPPPINDNLLRSQFYQNSGNNSYSNITNAPGSGSPKISSGSPKLSSTNSPKISMNSPKTILHHSKVTIANNGKIQDLQTNFGEILNNPAPAAFSPQFTSKSYANRYGNHHNNSSNNNSLVDNNSSRNRSGITMMKSNTSGDEEDDADCDTHSSHELAPQAGQKTVFMKALHDTNGELPMEQPMEETPHSVSISTCAPGGDGEESEVPHTATEKKQFLNKRAGHYNEFKVLQAMRAKLAAEEEDEDEDDC